MHLSWRRGSGGGAAAALCVLSLAGPAFTSQDPGTTSSAARGCEPSADVGMSARIVFLEDEGPTASLLIELALDPRVTIPEAAIEGRLLGPGGAIEAPGLERRPLAVLKGVNRRFLYRLDLAQGEDHHLLFTLRPSDPSFTGPAPSAHLEVSLDPSRRPERHGAYLQYRAKAERP